MTVARIRSLSCLLAMVALASVSIATTEISQVYEPAVTGIAVNDAAIPMHLVRVAYADVAHRWVAIDDDARPDAPFDWAAFASFDLAQPSNIKIISREPIRSFKVLPSTQRLHVQVTGSQLSFEVSKPGPLTIELNEDEIHSLHLFVNPPQSDAPTTSAANMIYFGPGVHDVRQTIQVGSNQSVYLADGAIMRSIVSKGPVFELKGQHIHFTGRGIIDGFSTPLHTGNLISIHDCDDVLIEGIILHDSAGWNMPVRRSGNVTIRNVKIIGGRANSDGIDICNCHDVTVEDCFIRTFDDLVVIKSDIKQGPVDKILVQRCVLWSELAHALSLGAELYDPISNVTFRDCDVIHDKGREWALRVFNSGSASVKDITFENIRVEESRKLISLWIGRNSWSKQPDSGHIQHILFQNISAATESSAVEMVGFDADHIVDDVTLDHVSINRKPLTESEIHKNGFVQNITVKP